MLIGQPSEKLYCPSQGNGNGMDLSLYIHFISQHDLDDANRKYNVAMEIQLVIGYT